MFAGGIVPDSPLTARHYHQSVVHPGFPPPSCCHARHPLLQWRCTRFNSSTQQVEDGNWDAISIDSNPLLRLLGKLIASRFPSPRRAIIPVGEPAKAGAGEGPGEGRQQGLPDRPEPLSVSHGTSPVAVPKGFYPPRSFRSGDAPHQEDSEV